MDGNLYLKDRAGNPLGTATNPLYVYATAGATSTINHNQLAGKQGGATNEYYHLNATSYASVIAWDVGSGSSAYASVSGYATISGTATDATYSITSGTATQATNSASLNNHSDTYFATSGATLGTIHNNLIGLEGVGTNYYHLNSTQYASINEAIGNPSSGDMIY
jgi:hypothetical protein